MVVADEHEAQNEEGLMNVGATFIAYAQATEAVEPSQGAFYAAPFGVGTEQESTAAHFQSTRVESA